MFLLVTEKGVITKGVLSLEESLESLKSLNALENGQMVLCFPDSGDCVESLESLKSLDLKKTPFPKDPLFPVLILCPKSLGSDLDPESYFA